MNEQSIFSSALERDEAERARFLDDACAGNPELRQRVEQLIRSHEAASRFMVQPAGQLAMTVDQPSMEKPGTQIGPYRLLQELGQGGMGVVYMAEQKEPVKRRVALKIIKPGMDTRQVIARFEAERQALAMMDHPNIAKVLDAGATDTGRPYFVMELVKGMPLTDYCDQQRLTARERLELFVPVCQAVQHAHQKGIIHRDIKPSNILVALFDGRPVPKVIDFGVAKATNQTLTEKTMFTQLGQIVGTLEYMSPEQAQVNQLDVDTRTDVYSLGVVLYELLAGDTPFDRQRLRSAAFDEVLRIIREEEPPKPSTRLSSSAALPSIAASRQTEPQRLSGMVRGDLDWIVMKSLEKERERRYETANGLAADIQRYLNDEPVTASPPSAAYRFRKFVRRNKTGFMLTAAGSLAILVFVGSIGWVVRDRIAREEQLARENIQREEQVQRERESREAQIAAEKAQREERLEEKITEALDESMTEYDQERLPESFTAFKRVDSLLASGDAIRDKLRGRIEEWRSDLTIVARLHELSFFTSRDDSPEFEHGYLELFRGLEIDVDSLPLEEAGRRIRARRVGRSLIDALDSWAYVRHELYFQQELKKLGVRYPYLKKNRLLQVARAADSDVLRNQTRLIAEANDGQAGIKLLESPEVLFLPASTLKLLLMVVHWNGGRGDLASQLLEKAILERPADFHLNWMSGYYYLAAVKPPLYEEAAQAYLRALAIRPDEAAVRGQLAQALNGLGKVEEAEACYRKAIELDPRFALAHCNLGVTLGEQGKLVESIACYRKAIELDPGFALAHCNLGSGLSKQGKLDEGIACYRKAIELDSEYAAAHVNLGLALKAQGKLDEAVTCYRRAIQLDSENAKTHNNLGAALKDQGKLDEAITCYRRAIELDSEYAMAHNNLGAALKDQGKLDEAITYHRRAVELDSEYAMAHNNLGVALHDQRKLDEAVTCYRKAIELDPKLAMAHCNLGVVLRNQGELNEAVTCYRKAIELDPHFAMAHVNLGSALRDQGRLDEAIACYRKVIEFDPEFAIAHNNLGGVMKRLGKLDEAIACYREAIEVDPNYLPAYFNLDIALTEPGKEDEAERYYQQLLSIQTVPPDVYNALAWLLTNCVELDRRNPIRAVKLARNAVELKPGDGGHWNTLGAAQYRAGDWKASIESLKKSDQLLGDQALAFNAFFLAMAHWKLEQADVARQWYEKAVVWMQLNAPDNEELLRFRDEAASLLGISDSPPADGTSAHAQDAGSQPSSGER